MPERRKLPRVTKPLAIRIAPPLMERIKAVALKMGLSDSEVMRLAMEIGFEKLKRIDYNIPKAVVDAAEAVDASSRQTGAPQASAADKKKAFEAIAALSKTDQQPSRQTQEKWNE